MNAADHKLLRRWIRHGDAEAFAGIVRAHSGMVYATCRRILGNAADAEDAAQDCFLKLARSKPRIRTSLAGWLHTLATHTAINRIRSDARRREREIRYGSRPSETVEVQWDDLAPIIDETIAALPEKLRYPVIAHFLEGETHGAIAGKLGLDQSTVTRRIHKGLEEIRKSLRRRGVAVVSSSLAALMAGNAVEAAPTAMTASLGKIAIASAAPQTAAATGSGATLLGGAILMKSKLTVISLVVALLLGLAIFSVRTIQRSPDDLVALPSDSADGSDVVAPDVESSDTDLAASPETDSLDAATNSASVTGVESFVDESLLGSISGIVIDPRQVLPEGTRVYAWKRRIGDKESVTHHVPIDEWNRFELSGLETGSYSLYIMPGNQLFDRGRTDVVLEPGESLTGLTLVFDDPLAITGRVTDEYGNPVAGADISHNPPNQTLATRTTQRGDYALMFLDDYSLYELYASHENFRGASRSRIALGDTNVDFVLREKIEFTVEGVVRRADTGEPLPQYGIRWDRPNTPASSLLQVNNALYRRVEHPEGRFTLTITQLDEWDEYGALIGIRASQFAPKATAVSFTHPGQIVRNVEILLHPGKVLEGVVRTDKGEPIEDAKVYLGPLRNVSVDGEFSYVSSPQLSVATTISDGSFRIYELSSGDTLLTVQHRDYAPSWVDLTPAHIASSNIEVTLSEGAVVQLPVELFALPLSKLEIYFPNHPAFDFFDLEPGANTSFPHLPPGEAEVSTTLSFRLEVADHRDHSGTAYVYHRLRLPAFLENGRTTKLDFEFERGGAVLEGTTTVDSRWPSGERVIVRTSNDADVSESFYTYINKETGYYRLERLPGGVATVEVVGGGRDETDPWTRIAVELRDGFVTTQDIVIDSGEVPPI